MVNSVTNQLTSLKLIVKRKNIKKRKANTTETTTAIVATTALTAASTSTASLLDSCCYSFNSAGTPLQTQ